MENTESFTNMLPPQQSFSSESEYYSSPLPSSNTMLPPPRRPAKRAANADFIQYMGGPPNTRPDSTLPSIERYTPAPPEPQEPYRDGLGAYYAQQGYFNNAQQGQFRKESTAWSDRGYPEDTPGPSQHQFRKESTAWSDRGYPEDTPGPSQQQQTFTFRAQTMAPLASSNPPSSPSPARQETPRASTAAPNTSKKATKKKARTAALVPAASTIAGPKLHVKDHPCTPQEKIRAVQIAVEHAEEAVATFVKGKKKAFWKVVHDKWSDECWKIHSSIERMVTTFVNDTWAEYQHRIKYGDSGEVEDPQTSAEIAACDWVEVLKDVGEHKATNEELTRDRDTANQEKADLLVRMSKKTPLAEKKITKAKEKVKAKKDAVPLNLGYDEDIPNGDASSSDDDDEEDEEQEEETTKKAPKKTATANSSAKRTRMDVGDVVESIGGMQELWKLEIEGQREARIAAKEEHDLRVKEDSRELLELREKQSILQRQMGEEAESRRRDSQKLDKKVEKIEQGQEELKSMLGQLLGRLGGGQAT